MKKHNSTRSTKYNCKKGKDIAGLSLFYGYTVRWQFALSSDNRVLMFSLIHIVYKILRVIYDFTKWLPWNFKLYLRCPFSCFSPSQKQIQTIDHFAYTATSRLVDVSIKLYNHIILDNDLESLPVKKHHRQLQDQAT